METLEPLNERCEILFVDGGSTDGTLALLKDRYPVIQSPKGRAKQMNMGAEESSGDVLFFLHCDSEVPPTALEEIETVMKKYRAGCFGIAFHSYNFFMFTCRVISNHRIKDRKVMFGDQGIFIDRKLFFEVGKFPEMPILEDYQFSLILKEKGIPLGMTQDLYFRQKIWRKYNRKAESNVAYEPAESHVPGWCSGRRDCKII